MKRILAALFALTTLPAQGYIADGHSWEITCNKNGFLLETTLPVSRIIGYGIEATVSETPEKLILGRSCDAAHNVLGKGSWCYSNGGFEARFEYYDIGFGHKQEPWCESGPEIEMDCMCQD